MGERSGLSIALIAVWAPAVIVMGVYTMWNLARALIILISTQFTCLRDILDSGGLSGISVRDRCADLGLAFTLFTTSVIAVAVWAWAALWPYMFGDELTSVAPRLVGAGAAFVLIVVLDRQLRSAIVNRQSGRGR